MGLNRWDEDRLASYSMSVSSMDRGTAFSRRSTMDDFKSGQNLNPENINYRESRDSEYNPESTPIMVGLDVTGSMGSIPHAMAGGGLCSMVDYILQRQPVTDPQILFMGIGDAVKRDQAPLQMTQFEADECIMDQLRDIFIESGGGNNAFESYDLAWSAGVLRTSTDAWQKRGQKTYLFTVGDEEFPKECEPEYMKHVFKGSCPQAPTPDGMLEKAQETHHVFHIIVAEGSHASSSFQQVRSGWRDRLGRRALTLRDHTLVGELITSAIAVNEGIEPDDAADFWQNKETADIIREALKGEV